MLAALKRVFKSGWLSFSRDGGIAAATIFILLMTVFLVSSLFLLSKVSQLLIDSLEEKVDISIYFKEGSTESEILDFQEELSKVPEVEKMEYISREDAFEAFMEKHKDEPVLIESLEEVGKNPFLASLNIKAREASQYQAVADFLEEDISPSFKSLIEKVDYYQRKPVIDKIFSLTSVAKRAGITFLIILAIVAFSVIFNTIRLAIYNSREEIKIQKLVGASNWFIRGPFLVQGAISGLFATFSSLLILTLVCWIFAPKFELFFADINLFTIFVQNFWIIFLVQIFTGIGLGVISSLVAIRKHLEV